MKKINSKWINNKLWKKFLIKDQYMKFIKNVKKKLNFFYQEKNNEKIKLYIYIINNFNVNYT